jgi:Effector immunity protein Tgi2PP
MVSRISLPNSAATPHTVAMRCLFTTGLLLAGAAISPAIAQSAAPSSAQAPAPAQHRLTTRQARQLVLLVLRHDHIDLSDTHIELNSMDLGHVFIHGFVSYSIIRESTTPGPDETLRRYAVSRGTGDVWEINLCTHYDFPQLTRLRQSLIGQAVASGADIAAQSKELGCSDQKPVPTT